MKFAFRAVFFLFIFFLISCKKDKKDTLSPNITFNSPSNGQVYKMFDTVTVNARVSDNQHISYVNVTLTDANHAALQASYSVPVSSADFTFNIKYILTQFHLQSGNYYMQITADDGYNTTSSYQSIYITESPTQLWGYCAVLKNDLQHIVNYDSSMNIGSTISLTSAYNGMKYGTYYQQLYINGNSPMAFQAYDLQNHIQTYNASATGNQQNYTCVYTDGYKPYVGFLNGDIYSYTNTGSYSTSYRLNDPNFYPYYFTKTSAYGVGIFKSKIATVNDKIVTFSSSGAAFQSLSLDTVKKVIGVFEKSQDSLYVFGNNSSNEARISIYRPAENDFSTYILAETGTMLSAVQVNNQYIIFSTTTGIYAVSGFSLNPALLNISCQKLAYQPKLNKLFVASNTSLNTYSVSASALLPIASKVLGDSIIDFEVITNK